MTSYTMGHVADVLSGLNTWKETIYASVVDIRLNGPVVEPDSGEILGRITWDVDTEVYVFIPGAYEVYSE